jgi:hypothetical protein
MRITDIAGAIFYANLILQVASFAVGMHALRKVGIPWGLFLWLHAATQCALVTRRVFELLVWSFARTNVPADLFLESAIVSFFVTTLLFASVLALRRAIRRLDGDPVLDVMKIFSHHSFSRLTRKQKHRFARIDEVIRRLEDDSSRR